LPDDLMLRWKDDALYQTINFSSTEPAWRKTPDNPENLPEDKCGKGPSSSF